VYLGGDADESKPEKWRRDIAQAVADSEITPKVVAKHMMIHLLEDAFSFILYRCHMDRRWLFWPTPEGAKGHVDENMRKRRDARYHYHQEREAENNAGVTECVRIAARKAKASEQAVWLWKKQEGWE
jgi:hypothetical protein